MGIFLTILHIISKSGFLWLIGKYRRYNALVVRAEGFTKRVIRFSMFLVPIRNRKDKAALSCSY
jgi:hypothetical protein